MTKEPHTLPPKPTTKLGGILLEKANPAATPAPAKMSLLAQLAARGKLVEVPGLGPMYLRLIGVGDYIQVSADVDREMRAQSVELNVSTIDRFELARAARTLAIVARSADDHAEAFGSLDEWRSLDNDQLAAAWKVYSDLRDEMDPLNAPLTDEDRHGLTRVIMKRDREALARFGTDRIVKFMIEVGLDGLKALAQGKPFTVVDGGTEPVGEA